MDPFRVSEKTFHRFAQVKILSNYGLQIERSDSYQDGPFILKSGNGATVYVVGVTLDILAEWSNFDQTQFTVTRTREITRCKTWPALWYCRGYDNKPELLKAGRLTLSYLKAYHQS